MNKLLLFLALFLISLTQICNAQKEGNVWYFGQHAGINFNTTPPTPLTDGQTDSREGVATISDKNGNLLFYTEGTTVWDATQNIMPNGSGLQGDYSSTQSAIIVPDPGNANRYYLFTTAEFKGLRYSIVDMTLNGGLGDIIPAAKNISLLPDNASTEKLIATRHCNGKDYWVITHTLNDNEFYVYPVTTAGIGAPLQFSIGSVINTSGGEVTSYLKLSPDGNILANAFGNPATSSFSKVELMHFNNQNGAIGGPVTTLGDLNYPYGVEFSPNGNLLYVSTQGSRNIFQYDLLATDINGSRITIASSPNLAYGALQLGPDGKIYVSAENGYNIGYGYLGTISQPDSIGAACNYVQNAFYLGGENTLIGLPTFVGSFFYDPLDFVVGNTCIESAVSFKITNTNNIDAVKWDFGDGSKSEDVNPRHQYAAAGDYKVELIIFRPCRTDTAYKTITIHTTYKITQDIAICNGASYQLPNGIFTSTAGTYIDTLLASTGCDSIIETNLKLDSLPLLHLGNDTTICQGTSILLNAVSPNASYLWQDNSSDSVYTVTKAGSYNVHVANIFGCTNDDTVQINISDPSTINLGNDTTFCQGDTLILNAASPNANYLWQDNSTDSVYAATLAGKYKVIVTNPFLCASQDSVNIAINPSPAVNLGNDTTICQGTSIMLNAFNNNSTYQWQDGSINPGYLVNQAGNYSVIVTNNFACVDSDEIKVDTSENPVLELGNDTTICSNDTLLLNAAWPNSTYLWQDGSQDAVFAATLAGNYSVLVTNNFYCSATDQINIAVNPAPIIDLGNDTTLCNGNTFLLDASSPGAANYLWQDGSALSFYNVMQSGPYWVTVTNINNCFASDSINIIATDIPTLQLSLDTISICPGQQIPLAAIATNADSYLWEDGSTDSARIITKPQQWYYVTATNGCGSVSDSLYASLSICYLYVPTAFSPNMDGHNDFFQPKFTDIISKYHLTIFSRWGEKVFSSTNPLNGWDGKYKNANCDTGAYVWMMQYIDRTGKPVFLHGALTLIR